MYRNRRQAVICRFVYATNVAIVGLANLHLVCYIFQRMRQLWEERAHCLFLMPPRHDPAVLLLHRCLCDIILTTGRLHAVRLPSADGIERIMHQRLAECES